MNIKELRKEVVEKYGSIHNFCKLHKELTRATVYLVFAEKYAGNIQKQIMHIENALNNSDIQIQKNFTLEEAELTEVIQQTKCNNCRLLRPNCSDCKRKTLIESSAVYNFINTKL